MLGFKSQLEGGVSLDAVSVETFPGILIDGSFR
jgi:hypothetical protein